MINRTIKMLTTAISIALILITISCCGGGGGGDSPALITVSGVAATGAALAGADVYIKDSSNKVYTGKTGSSGTFSVSSSDMKSPFIIIAKKNTTVLVSFAGSPGNVNVTPVTTQIVSLALGTDASLSSIDSITIPDADDVDDIADKYLAILKSICSGDPGLSDMLAGFDIFSTSFTANGTGFDMILDSVAITVADYSAGNSLTATVGGTSVFINIDTPSTADFTSITAAMTAKALAQKEKYEKKVLFIAYDEAAAKAYLYRMFPDGTGVKKISELPENVSIKGFLSVSPDGESFLAPMAFYATDSDGLSVFLNDVINRYSMTDGSFIEQIVGNCGMASYSPDGKMIAAQAAGDDNETSLYVYFFEDKSIKRAIPSGIYPDTWNWSTDSSAIYLSGTVESEDKSSSTVKGESGDVNSDIYRVTSSGSFVNLTNTSSVYECYPAISPDSSSIAYIIVTYTDNSSGGKDAAPYLYTGTVSGNSITGSKKISDVMAISPVWSPDGGRIIFMGRNTDTGNACIYSIKPDGTGLKKLIDMTGYNITSMTIQQ